MFDMFAGGVSVELREATNFKMKITTDGNELYANWRESDIDDILLAAAMAAWLGEMRLWSILKLPPMPRPPIEARQPTLDELIKLQPGRELGRRPRI